jgi:hypothetical protein
MTINQDAEDKEIQRAVMEVVTSYSMVQIHEQPTRGNNLLDIVLTTNSSLLKSSNNSLEISSHDMVVTDCDTQPYYQCKRPRRCYIYSKANWDKLHEDLTKLSPTIINMHHTGPSVQNIWDIYKTELFEYLDKHIPSKLIRSTSHLPWINHKIRKMFKTKARLYHQAKKTNKWTNYRHF